jgi:hypothetical protein
MSDKKVQDQNLTIPASRPVAGRARRSKISWADLTDSEFKAKKLSWADLSEEIWACSPADSSSADDADTVSTEAPSPSWDALSNEAPSPAWACAEPPANFGNEYSDVEQEQGAQDLQWPAEFMTEDMLGLTAWDLGAQDLQSLTELPSDDMLGGMFGEYWSWPNGDWNDYSFQVTDSTCEIAEAWPSDFDCFQFASLPFDGQDVIADEPLCTPLQEAHCKAVAAALAHQQAVALAPFTWQSLKHQEAYSKALEAASRPLAKGRMPPTSVLP